MRNRARNRKEQEKEAERQAAYYAPGNFFDTFLGLDGLDLEVPLVPLLRAAKPLCYLDPCNDPTCRMDHPEREMRVFDGDMSKYWER